MSVQAQISGDIKIRDLEGGLYAEGGIVTSKPFGEANGFATLGGDGKVPSSQLPSYVDDVVEVANYAALPIPGETGKIYITLDTNYVYRWAGSTYVQIIDTSAVWGAITGTLSNQTDLQNALDAKVPYTGATGNVDLGTYGIKADYSQFNLTPSSVPTTVGTLSWDAFYRTLQLVDGDGDTTLQIGQEQRTLVHNNTGSTLLDGQVVYVTGSTGELPSVALASNTSETTSSVTFGVVTESIANGADGFITTSGIVHGLNTLGFNEGDAIWLGSTAGTFTNVKPVAPENSVLVGYVIKKAGGNGSIFVKIQNGYELEELHDVLITSVANNQGIFWDSATSLWKNKSIPTALGYTPLGGDGVSGRIPYYTGTATLGNEAAFNYDANTNRLGVNTNTPNATIGANAGTDSGYSLLLKNSDTNYNGIGFGTDSTYGNLIATEKIGTALTRNLTLFNQGGYVSLTEAGNFGIGMINPNTGLDIYNGTNSYLWLHNAATGITGTDGVRLALFSTKSANLRNFDGAFSVTAEGDFSVITLGAENIRVNSADGKVGIGAPATVPEMLTVNGSIQQTGVTSALVKTNASGKLIPAVAGSDYLIPSAISGTTNSITKFTSASTIGNSNISDNGSLITLGSTTYVSSGNFGVGTATPAVAGVGIDIYSATSAGLRLHNAASGTTVSDGAGINFSAGLNLGITNYEAGTIDIVTNGNSGVYIASNGYVGINGGSAGYPLDVLGSIKQTGVTSSMLKADASGVLVAAVAGTDYQAPLSNIVTGFSAANNVALWSGTTTLTGTSNLWYNSTSNFLGIGTNNPQRRLTIFNATLDSQVQISGGAPSVALTDAVTGSIYQAKFAMATAAGHYVSGAVAGDFVLLSQTGATIFATSSTEKMRVNTSGRLLLGTTTDNGSLLQVAGSATFTGALSGTSASFSSTITISTSSTTYGSAFYLANTSNSKQWNFTTVGSAISGRSGNLEINNNATDIFAITQSGNVGIGTTSPSAKLDVFGNIRLRRSDDSTQYMDFYAASGLGYIEGVNSASATYQPLVFRSGNNSGSVERMRISDSGNVGIGTSSPSGAAGVALAINGGANQTRIALKNSVTGDAAGDGFQIVLDAGGQDVTLEQRENAILAFATNAIERMRITSGGNVGIGTSSPSYILSVSQFNTSGEATIGITNTSTASNTTKAAVFKFSLTDTVGTVKESGGIYVYPDSGLPNVQSAYMLFATRSGDGGPYERMRITSNGTVGLNGSADVNNASGIDKLSIGYLNSNYGWIQTWNATSLYLNKIGNAVYAGTQRIDNNSDARIKENIAPIENALDVVLALKGRKFNMLDEDNILRYGFVAQEVQSHLSDFVTESDRTFEKGDIKIENLLTLESSGAAWGALLVEAIKQQQAQIEELKKLINNK